MDSLYDSDRKLGDLEDSGVSDFLLDQDIFPASNMFHELTSNVKDQHKGGHTDRVGSPELFSWCPEIKLSTDQYVDNDWFNSLLEDPVLNDKMITDAVQSPRITSEHSYSLNNDQGLNSPLSALCKMDDFGKDIDTDIFDSNHGALDLSQKNYAPAQIVIKQEPMETDRTISHTNTAIATTTTNTTMSNINNNNNCSSNNGNSNNFITTTNSSNNNMNSINNSAITSQLPSSPTTQSTSIVQPTIIFTTTANCQVKTENQILPNISIKAEPTDFMDTSPDHPGFESINLPPTPPSSNTSDSEGSLSPQRSAPPSPVRPVSATKPIQSGNNKHISQQPLFTNPIPQSGYLVLSEEEKRTLIAEGYPIPGKLPLTKQEEKNLKKIRRKIKNKISAQESRRKKKEYLEALEKRVESFTQENVDLKKRVDSLETNNRSLLGQLQKLQALCGKMPRPSSASSTQTGTVLMVVVLSFAVFIGSWAPTSLNIGYSSPSTHPDPIFYSNPRPMHPSPAMGPQLQNVRVDDYTTPSMKSRVLLSVRDDLEDDGLFGPDVPMRSVVDGQEFDGLSLKTNNSSLMGKMPVLWALSSLEPGLTNKINRYKTEPTFSVALQSTFYYNKSSSMAIKLRATMHPDITGAADILPFEKFGNSTAEIESQ